MGLLDFMETEEERRRIEQARLASLIAKELRYETRKSEKAAQRESDRQNFQDYVQDKRFEAARVDEGARELASILDKILADDGSVTPEDASEALIQSMLFIGAESAELLGSQFSAVHHWVLDADDAEGLFSMSDQASSLTADDLDYRRRVAIAVAGPDILRRSLEPWADDESKTLSIFYASKAPHCEFELDGPLNIGSRTIFVGKDARRGQVKFFELNQEFWKLKEWVSIPLSKEIAALSYGYLCWGRTGRFFAFDQSGSYLYANGTLFRIDASGQTTPIGSVDLSNMGPVGETFSCAVYDRGNNVPLQLISTSEKLVLLTAVAIGPSKDVGRNSVVAFVAIDASTGELLWRDPDSFLGGGDSKRSFVGMWRYRPETGGVCYFEDYFVEEPIKPVPDKRSFFQKMIGGDQQIAKPNTKRYCRIVEKSLLSGEVINQWDLGDRIECHSSGIFVTGDGDLLHLFGISPSGIGGYSSATFDLRDGALSFSSAQTYSSHIKPMLSPARLGSCRLHAIVQLLRNGKIKISQEGDVVGSTAELVRTYVFRIKVKIGDLVNVAMQGLNQEDAERKLKDQFANCEILEVQLG